MAGKTLLLVGILVLLSLCWFPPAAHGQITDLQEGYYLLSYYTYFPFWKLIF